MIWHPASPSNPQAKVTGSSAPDREGPQSLVFLWHPPGCRRQGDLDLPHEVGGLSWGRANVQQDLAHGLVKVSILLAIPGPAGDCYIQFCWMSRSSSQLWGKVRAPSRNPSGREGLTVSLTEDPSVSWHSLFLSQWNSAFCPIH